VLDCESVGKVLEPASPNGSVVPDPCVETFGLKVTVLFPGDFFDGAGGIRGELSVLGGMMEVAEMGS
jgi:hypothetical protein